MCRDCKRATNNPNTSEFFHEVEKHIKKQLHDRKLQGFANIAEVAEVLFESSTGSNEFLAFVESKLLEALPESNIQE